MRRPRRRPPTIALPKTDVGRHRTPEFREIKAYSIPPKLGDRFHSETGTLRSDDPKSTASTTTAAPIPGWATREARPDPRDVVIAPPICKRRRPLMKYCD